MNTYVVTKETEDYLNEIINKLFMRALIKMLPLAILLKQEKAD